MSFTPFITVSSPHTWYHTKVLDWDFFIWWPTKFSKFHFRKVFCRYLIMEIFEFLAANMSNLWSSRAFIRAVAVYRRNLQWRLSICLWVLQISNTKYSIPKKFPLTSDASKNQQILTMNYQFTKEKAKARCEKIDVGITNSWTNVRQKLNQGFFGFQ